MARHSVSIGALRPSPRLAQALTSAGVSRRCAPGAGAEPQRPEGDALERVDGMADRLAHPPDLALAALVDGHLEHAGPTWRTFAGAVRPSSSSTPSRRLRSARSVTGPPATRAR